MSTAERQSVEGVYLERGRRGNKEWGTWDGRIGFRIRHEIERAMTVEGTEGARTRAEAERG